MTNIREMTSADLDTALDLRQKWLSSTVDAHAISPGERDWFAAHPGNPQALALVANDNVRCIGYLLCSWHGHPTMSGSSAEIDEIYVVPEYQRRGIGRSLVERARELLLERVDDLTGIRACSDRNDVSSRAFWQALGYEHHVVEFVDYLE